MVSKWLISLTFKHLDAKNEGLDLGFPQHLVALLANSNHGDETTAESICHIQET